MVLLGPELSLFLHHSGLTLLPTQAYHLPAFFRDVGDCHKLVEKQLTERDETFPQSKKRGFNTI
jgi:hypothetical protein